MDYCWDYCHEIHEPADYIDEDDEEDSTDAEETKDEEQDKTITSNRNIIQTFSKPSNIYVYFSNLDVIFLI